MRDVACLLAVLFLAAAGSAVTQEKRLIDPMLPGSLNPKPLPPLKNPDAPSTPAKELFARKSTPFPGPSRSIGGDFDGCLAGAVSRLAVITAICVNLVVGSTHKLGFTSLISDFAAPLPFQPSPLSSSRPKQLG
jgi:hypothetical protein